jgi:hypothetical protein
MCATEKLDNNIEKLAQQRALRVILKMMERPCRKAGEYRQPKTAILYTL